MVGQSRAFSLELSWQYIEVEHSIIDISSSSLLIRTCLAGNRFVVSSVLFFVEND